MLLHRQNLISFPINILMDEHHLHLKFPLSFYLIPCVMQVIILNDVSKNNCAIYIASDHLTSLIMHYLYSNVSKFNRM